MEPTSTPQLDPTDEALCAQVASGDRIAEEMLVMRYTRLVRVCARPFFLAGGDSEDLIQEGMLGLLTAVREFRVDRGGSFRTFAETCVRNRLLSAIKTATRGKHAPLNHSISFETPSFDVSADYVAFTPQSGQTDPEAMLISREDYQERTDRLKDHLSGFEAEILGLYLNGLSYSDIAAHVNRPPKSVDNAVQRIRRKLAQQFPFGDFSES